MIAIIDYGAGNMVSVKKALDWLGYECEIVADATQVTRAAKLILPGVGHFAATAALARSGLQSAISERIEQDIPFLGICVGMQWMFQSSDESPDTKGLGVFTGNCERFPGSVRSPHVGWNQVEMDASPRLFRDVPPSSFVYFTHSYRVPPTAATSALCDYGGRFSAAVERGHLFGVQFHPEKSGEVGLTILRNFCSL